MLQKGDPTYEFYKNQLNGLNGIRFVDVPSEDYFSNRWLSTALMEGDVSREDLRKSLEI